MYCVNIKDADGQEIAVEVSLEVYQIFEDERRELERERDEQRRHHVKCEIEDYFRSHESIIAAETPEDIVYLKDALQSIREILKTCLPVQRERFYLHYVRGFSYGEIARLQGCTKRAVWKSLAWVNKKIKNSING